jgi:hypothetical protein
LPTGVEVGKDIHKQLAQSFSKLKTVSSSDAPNENYGFMI